MQVDDESVKNITNITLGGLLLGALAALGRLFWKVGGLPKRVDAIEARESPRDILVLAIAEHQFTTGKEKAEARKRLREAHGAMLAGMTERK